MTKEKVLVVLDASALGNSACMLKLFNTVVLGYTSKLQNNDVEFGTAFHKFRKIFRDKGEEGLALGIKVAKDYFKNTPMKIKENKKYLTTTFLMQICLEYAEKYKKDQFDVIRVRGKKAFHTFSLAEQEKIQIKENRIIGLDELFDYEEPLLELKLAFPYYVDDDMEILMAGTIDEIGKLRSGIVCVCDAKTTSSWDIREYFSGFDLSYQLRFYKWAIKKYVELYPNSFISELCGKELGFFIDGIFYKGENQPVEYKRSDVMLYQDDRDSVEMETLIAYKAQQLISAIKVWLRTSLTPYREGMLVGACENKFGKCSFFKPCASVDKVTRDVVLEYNFVRKPYNPLNHGE